ncbi:ATP-binding protein [Nitrosomonas communis]|uniref:ATP-binding protein n=1 Tax=Nitrosomonas communis TaxID=44574 RepID=UPI003D2AF14D
MSNVNIKRAVDNIRSGTNAYTPLVEVVVNAIQAIEHLGMAKGMVEIEINRSRQAELNDSPSDIDGFTVIDNGIGFNDENREAFDTLYTDQKIAEGGKGFGRFTCLKYFHDIEIDSVYFDGTVHKNRTFKIGKETEIIVDETILPSKKEQTGSTIKLISLRKTFPDKSIAAIARTLVEKLLSYFISEDRICPQIVLREADNSESVLLNTYLSNLNYPLIVEVIAARGEFSLESRGETKSFAARVFKLYSPKTHRSKISLVAHRREVVSTSLHNYIPEFSEEFYDTISIDGEEKDRNFIVAVYVFSDYLDDNVSIERGGFEFNKDQELLLGISQKDIEASAAEYARQAVASDVFNRQERKASRIKQYVRENAPWHTELLSEVDFTKIPYNPTNEEIENYLHQQKYAQEVKVKREVQKLLNCETPDQLQEKATDIVRKISESSRSELAHYVALRRSVLDIFDRSLALNQDGSYSSENVVHDIIFPRKRDNDTTPFLKHNLWIIDERLNFSEYLSSDLPLDGQKGDRPDLLAFDKRIGFREDNEPSNPVTIFEFKRPQRDNFVNPSSKEDPVQQIVRYVIQIKEGKYRTPRGREILVATNTPFYGYVVCELTAKVRGWLENEKDFKPMPDRMGYFKWHENLNLYIEVLGWDKVLKDAVMRNRIFFHKLGIE